MNLSQIHSMDVESMIPVSQDNHFGVETGMDLFVPDAPNEMADLSTEDSSKLQADLQRIVWGPLHSRYLFFIMGLMQLICGMQFALTPYIMNEPPRFPICEDSLGALPELRRLFGGDQLVEGIKTHKINSVQINDDEKKLFEKKVKEDKQLCLPDEPLVDFDCETEYKYYFEGLSVVESFFIPSSVCESNPLKNTNFPRSALFLGFGIGAWLSGIWMDRFGRRKSISFSVFVFLVSGISTAFATDLVSFFIFRFITGFALSGASIGSLILICELTNRRNRRKIFVSYSFFFLCGILITVFLGTYVLQWELLILLVTLPAVFVPFWISCVRFNVESPRFYLAAGDTASALAVYRAIATYNGNGLEEKMANIDELNVKEFVEVLFDDIDEVIPVDDVDVKQVDVQDLENSPQSENFLFDEGRASKHTEGRENWCGLLTSWPMHLWVWNLVLLYSLCQVQYYGITLDTSSMEQAYDVFTETTGVNVDSYLLPEMMRYSAKSDMDDDDFEDEEDEEDELAAAEAAAAQEKAAAASEAELEAWRRLAETVPAKKGFLPTDFEHVLKNSEKLPPPKTDAKLSETFLTTAALSVEGLHEEAPFDDLVPDANQEPVGVSVYDDENRYDEDNWMWMREQAMEKYIAMKNFRISDMENIAAEYMESRNAKLSAMIEPSHPLSAYFSSIRHFSSVYVCSSIAEFLFQMAAVWFCGWNIFGRKSIVTGWLVTSGLVIIFMGALKLPFAVSHMPETFFGTLFVGCGTTARLLTMGAMTVLQLFMIELFPTSVRGGAYGFAVMMGSISTVFAPYVYRVTESVFPGSFIIALGALVIFVSATTLATIPDTLNRPSFDTLLELRLVSENDPTAAGTSCRYCCHDFVHKILCCCNKNSEYHIKYRDMMSQKAMKRTALMMVLEGKKEMRDVINKTKSELKKFSSPRKETPTKRID
eukprot:GHVH01006342.1.p1 GENE.GHVH01006342.1~~GHVH01006342.1.p1  ORF type:complete len:938 (+),score=143.20 GHVH01006342.1:204-3017(+)